MTDVNNMDYLSDLCLIFQLRFHEIVASSIYGQNHLTKGSMSQEIYFDIKMKHI